MADQSNGIGTQQAIDNLVVDQSKYLEQQQNLNNQIVDKGIEKAQMNADFQKQELEKEATKNAKALYSDYQKEQNQYGANAEVMASQGLANSGYAESSRVNLYNNYQNNVTALMNEMASEKAKVDLQMNQAMLDADIQKAQNAVNILQQKMELTMNTYGLRYQLYRDQVADEQWEKQYQLQLSQMAQNQANADRDYQLSLAKLNKSSGGSSSSGGTGSPLLTARTGDTTQVSTEQTSSGTNKEIVQEILQDEAKTNNDKSNSGSIWSTAGKIVGAANAINKNKTGSNGSFFNIFK